MSSLALYHLSPFCTSYVYTTNIYVYVNIDSDLFSVPYDYALSIRSR